MLQQFKMSENFRRWGKNVCRSAGIFGAGAKTSVGAPEFLARAQKQSAKRQNFWRGGKNSPRNAGIFGAGAKAVRKAPDFLALPQKQSARPQNFRRGLNSRLIARILLKVLVLINCALRDGQFIRVLIERIGLRFPPGVFGINGIHYFFYFI